MWNSHCDWSTLHAHKNGFMCKYRSRRGGVDKLTLTHNRATNPDLFVVARGEDLTLTHPRPMEILGEKLRSHHHHYLSQPKIEWTSINLKLHHRQHWSEQCLLGPSPKLGLMPGYEISAALWCWGHWYRPAWVCGLTGVRAARFHPCWTFHLTFDLSLGTVLSFPWFHKF